MKRLIIFTLLLTLAAAPANAQWLKGIFKKKAPADTVAGMQRLTEVMNLLQKQYVSDPNTDKLSEDAIRYMLKTLDPHSIYVPAKEVKRTNEALQGNFEGVGITFSVIDDTIRVQEVFAGGPAEKVGMMPGDKFLRMDGVNATGDSAVNSFVFRHLRGKKGTVVVTDMLRGKDSITFHIVRDRIPIHSIEVYFMEDDSIGYISLMRFARNSVSEFRKALDQLRKQGMQSLILDLRGNSGGYLDIACGLSNEFLSPGRMIVYQEGRNRPRQDFRAARVGHFRKGDLVVLIDEGSASASEIVSGAVQDWDRGLIIGRRSYGKGLVQTMYNLSDGAQVRITTARYYTPSGRCIQRPYDNGTDEYNRELQNRYKHGELFSADSIHFPDSLKGAASCPTSSSPSTPHPPPPSIANAAAKASSTSSPSIGPTSTAPTPSWPTSTATWQTTTASPSTPTSWPMPPPRASCSTAYSTPSTPTTPLGATHIPSPHTNISCTCR